MPYFLNETDKYVRFSVFLKKVFENFLHPAKIGRSVRSKFVFLYVNLNVAFQNDWEPMIIVPSSFLATRMPIIIVSYLEQGLFSKEFISLVRGSSHLKAHECAKTRAM